MPKDQLPGSDQLVVPALPVQMSWAKSGTACTSATLRTIRQRMYLLREFCSRFIGGRMVIVAERTAFRLFRAGKTSPISGVPNRATFRLLCGLRHNYGSFSRLRKSFLRNSE